MMAFQESPDCFLAILLLGTLFASGYAQVPEVTIPQGTLQGKTLSTYHNRNISAFLGIPYGQPPIGEYRFRSPVAAGAWNGTLNATDDSSMCPQISGSQVRGEEDCLHLNVFTPQLPENVNSPLFAVMVFVHGGTFNTGSKTATENGPEYLLDKDVLLVVPNYRLGALGFLSTGDEVALGNWGLKDLVLALQWIRDNIAYFGGNPDSVTVFGHGAGGGATRLLSMSDLTTGLLHKFVTHSGSALLPLTHQPRAASVNRAYRLAEHLGCPTDTSTSLIACLREFNTSTILNSNSIFIVWQDYSDMNWGPTDEPNVEGALVLDTATNLLTSEYARDLPRMIGVTRDEGINPRFSQDTELFQSVLDDFDEAIPYILQTYYKYDNLTAYTQALKSFYLGDMTANTSVLLSSFMDLLGDGSFFYPAWGELQILSPFVGDTQYFYSFEYLGSSSSMGGSASSIGHGDELIYLFPLTDELSETDSAMVDIMVELWTSFAINGIPATTASNNTATWEPYSSLNNRMRIGNETDVQIGMEYHFHDERMQFWQELIASLTTTEETQAVSAAVPLWSNVAVLLTLVTYLFLFQLVSCGRSLL